MTQPGRDCTEGSGDSLRDRFGLCQWFHYEDFDLLESTVATLDDLGVRHLRTGVSWADWHRPGGREWYDWQMAALAGTGLDVLLSIWHTPPSISMDPSLGSPAVPPARTRDFADFVDLVIQRYGDGFSEIELWNEPNNPYKWDRRFDPDYRRFAAMALDAANWVRECGKVAVLGGFTLLDLEFLAAMERYGVLDHLDVVGMHAFPEMWEPYATSWDVPEHWYGWDHRVGAVHRHAGGLPVWVTETGLATYDKSAGRRCREGVQARRLTAAMEAPADRIYWYTLFDLPPERLAIEEANGGPREEPEYHMGLIRHAPGFPVEGHEKAAYHVLRDELRADRAAA